jgi:hypothetical protein
VWFFFLLVQFNLGFITEERVAAVLITPSLGVPNWSDIYIDTAPSHTAKIQIIQTKRGKITYHHEQL